MNSINSIRKVKYSDNRDSIVSLKEYICFENELEKKQYAIFKFQNNLNQKLSKMTFDVMQYDSENFMIRKTTINYEDFVAERGELFVPKMKMQFDIFTDHIEIELKYAKFERVEWVDGVMKPIPYTLDEFRDNKEKPEKKSSKEEKLLEKQRIKEIKRNNKANEKRTIAVNDVTKKNKPLISAVLATMMSLALVAFVVVSVVLFEMKSPLFSIGEFTYKKLDKDTVSIYKFNGGTDEVTISDKVDNYDIVLVDKKAFKNSKITSLTLMSPIEIGISSFENCEHLSKIEGIEFITNIGDFGFKNCISLTNFSSTELDSVGVGAFEGCISLSNVSIHNATIDSNAFKGDSKLTQLDIRDTKTNSLYGIFNFDGINLRKLKISRKTIEKGYFDKMNTLSELEFGITPNIEFGALKDTNIANHYMNETVEVLNGKIIAFEPDENGMVTLPKVITSKEQAINFLSARSSSIKAIQTEMKEAIDNDDLMRFANIEGFGILNDGAVSYTALNNINIKKIYWDSNSKSIDDTLYLPVSVNSIYVGNHNDTPISITSQLSGLASYEIDRLEIKNVKNIGYGSLEDLLVLNHLVITNYGRINLESFGVSKSLVDIVIKNSSSNNDLSCIINDYDDLESITFPTNITSLNSQISNCDLLHEIIVPKSVKTIGSNFISNCNINYINFEDESNLTTINNNFMSNCNSIFYIYLPYGLKEIGDYAFNNCINLSTIPIPVTVQRIGKYFVNNINVYSIEIPNSVTNLTLPVIGENCSVSRVITPFVGTSKDSSTIYSLFNLSSMYTNYLRVRGDLKISNTFFNNSTNLNTLIVDGKTTGIAKNVFAQLSYLYNIRINGDIPCTFRELFGKDMNLSDVVIDTESSITSQFFKGIAIGGALVINSYNNISLDAFVNLNSANRLFIGKHGKNQSFLNSNSFYLNTIYDSDGYLKVFGFYLENDVPEIAKDYGVSKTDYASFIRSTSMPEILD